MSRAASPWWAPHVHADKRERLAARGRIRDAVRRYFAGEGFTEVECGMLARSPGNETHLHAFATTLTSPGGENKQFYLHTSPEFACKKLLAAGERKIFSLGSVFRNRERGALHAPEFTMLEWYRVDEPYGHIMDDCLALVRLAAKAAGNDNLRFRGREAKASATAQRLSVTEAFLKYAGIDLPMALCPDGVPDRDAFAASAVRAGVNTAPGDSWSDIFSRVLVERIEANLGIGAATLLFEYPRQEAALARNCPHDSRFAERFELYVCGVEIANGFGELTDAKEQRRRFEWAMAEKERIHGERYPIDEDFLSALAQMPEASGAALGFDRLVMLATGAEKIEHVMWTPIT